MSTSTRAARWSSGSVASAASTCRRWSVRTAVSAGSSVSRAPVRRRARGRRAPRGRPAAARPPGSCAGAAGPGRVDDDAVQPGGDGGVAAVAAPPAGRPRPGRPAGRRRPRRGRRWCAARPPTAGPGAGRTGRRTPSGRRRRARRAAPGRPARRRTVRRAVGASRADDDLGDRRPGSRRSTAGSAVSHTTTYRVRTVSLPRSAISPETPLRASTVVRPSVAGGLRRALGGGEQLRGRRGRRPG